MMAAMDEQQKAKYNARTARQDLARAKKDGLPSGAIEELEKKAKDAQAIYENAVSDAQKNLQRLRLFGDGGQFLLEIQTRLMLNYKVLNGFFQAVSYGVQSAVQFDDALHQLQAISGAGYPGVPSWDIMGNVIPFIDGEEHKIETETKKNGVEIRVRRPTLLCLCFLIIS